MKNIGTDDTELKYVNYQVSDGYRGFIFSSHSYVHLKNFTTKG